MPDPDKQKQLKAFFVSLYRENEFERAGAASRLYNFLIQSKIHPEDVDLLIDGQNILQRNEDVLELLEAEIQRLRQENNLLKLRPSEPKISRMPTRRTRVNNATSAPPLHPRKPLRSISKANAEILQGLNKNPGCTIRELSYYLYGEPDGNENLADAVSNMRDRKLVRRELRERSPNSRSKWRYWIDQLGVELLNENISQQS